MRVYNFLNYPRFQQGAPAERYLGDEEAFQRLVTAAEDKNIRAHVIFAKNR